MNKSDYNQKTIGKYIITFLELSDNVDPAYFEVIVGKKNVNKGLVERRSYSTKSYALEVYKKLNSVKSISNWVSDVNKKRM